MLGSLVRGARAVLTAQLLVGIFTVALAGWTLGITNELLRERDRLRTRVVQLEETMTSRGMVAPPPPPIVDARPAADPAAYPPSLAQTAGAGAGPSSGGERSLTRFFGSLFSPPPRVQTVVLHVRSSVDADIAAPIAQALGREAGVRTLTNVLPAGDTRLSGYVYYDGRQSSAAADMVTQFHDLARRAEVAPWSAQLRGTALPGRDEYGAARLDLVLPPLPAPPAPALQVPPTPE